MTYLPRGGVLDEEVDGRSPGKAGKHNVQQRDTVEALPVTALEKRNTRVSSIIPNPVPGMKPLNASLSIRQLLK